MSVASPRSGCLAGRLRQARVAFGPHGFHGGLVAIARSSPPRGGVRLTRKRRLGSRQVTFALQGMFDSPRSLGRRLAFGRSAMAAGIGPLSALASALAGLALPRRLQIHAGPAGLGKADGDGLIGGAGAMLSFANVMHFFADKLTRLCAGRLPLALVFSGSFHGLLLWLGSALSSSWCAANRTPAHQRNAAHGVPRECRKH